MAVKKVAKPKKRAKLTMVDGIQREEQTWGVRLISKPLPDSSQGSVEITAEISHPRGERMPDIRYWFSGIPPRYTLRQAELIAWREALRAIQEEAAAVAKELKAPPKKPRPKKA